MADPISLSFHDSCLRMSDVQLLHGPSWLNDQASSNEGDTLFPPISNFSKLYTRTDIEFLLRIPVARQVQEQQRRLFHRPGGDPVHEVYGRVRAGDALRGA